MTDQANAVEVKQELDLESLKETNMPLKELKPVLMKNGSAAAFEQGNSLMLVVSHNEKIFKKRVSKKHFSGDLNGDILEAHVQIKWINREEAEDLFDKNIESECDSGG